MDNSQPALDAPRKLRIGRLEIGINLIVQIVVWIALVGMINYWSLRHFKRWDWGNNLNLELSPQTKSLLASLPKPVQAIVFFSGQNPEAEGDAVTLLKEYEYNSGGKLTMEIVDPDANFSRAKELSTKYKFGAQDSIIIFDYEGRSKFVNSADLATMEQMDPMEARMAMMQGRPVPPPRMLEFKGEQVMTSALIEISEAKQNKVYFVSGHGEHDYNGVAGPRAEAGQGLNFLKQNLSRQNLQHAELKLTDVDKIPDDASAVLVLGPRQDFSARDIKILNDYWERKGRFYFNVGPITTGFPNLNQWLAGRGFTLRNDDVLRVQNLGGFGVLARGGVLAENSPVLKGVEGRVIETESQIQSLLLDRTKETTLQLKLTDLMSAPQGFWGETTPMTGREAPMFDPKTDHQGPLTLAVQVEKGGSTDPKVKLETARLILFGTSDLLTDRGMQAAPVALDVTMNALNWLISRENLISIPPKTKEKYSYALTPEQIATIGWWVLAYIPLAVAIFGLYHLWWRHGKNLFLLTAWLAGAFLLLVGAWYLLLYLLGDEGAKQMPKALMIALSVAVALGVAAFGIHFAEQKRRLAALK